MWPDVQVRHLPGEGLGPQLCPGWEIQGSHVFLSSQLWAQVWARGDTHTHITQLRGPSAMQASCKHTHSRAHGRVQTPRYTHQHAVSLYGGCHPPHPLQLSESLTPPGTRPGHTPSSQAPPFPSLSLPPRPVPSATPLPAVSPIQKDTGCGTSTWGGAGGQNCCPPPDCPSSPLLPWDLSHLPSCGSHPRLGGSCPPVGPSS